MWGCIACQSRRPDTGVYVSGGSSWIHAMWVRIWHEVRAGWLSPIDEINVFPRLVLVLRYYTGFLKHYPSEYETPTGWPAHALWPPRNK